MRIVITGASGLIGTAMREAFGAAGHTVTPVVRRHPAPAGAVFWDPAAGRIDAAGLEDQDVVVHLAGENIGAGRWTRARKRRIRESRIRGTALLGEALAGLARPPRVLLAASAIGIYGDRPPDVAVGETAPPGTGFLPELGVAWEGAAEPARAAGIRVAHTRFGVLLSPKGGALAKMLPVFRLGLGGVLGSGRQVLSWIALDEVPRAALHVVAHDELAGPINFVAPEPVDNREFTRTLARVLRRPAPFRVPAAALRLAFGEMAETVLGGARVLPRRLLDAGYEFRWPRLEPALRKVLGRDG